MGIAGILAASLALSAGWAVIYRKGSTNLAVNNFFLTAAFRGFCGTIHHFADLTP